MKTSKDYGAKSVASRGAQEQQAANATVETATMTFPKYDTKDTADAANPNPPNRGFF
jgi:hypothetical protein